MSRRRVPKPTVKREPCERCKGRRWLISEAPVELYGGRMVSVARMCPACLAKGYTEPTVTDGKAAAQGKD